MPLVLSACLRYLLILALGLNGIALAQAAVASPSAATAHAAVPEAPVLAVPPAHAAVVAQPHCHEFLAGHPTGLKSPSPAPLHDGAQDGCCKGGVCTCAAPAVLAASFIAPRVPAVHERAVPLLDYRPSHLLPLPFRPPIA